MAKILLAVFGKAKAGDLWKLRVILGGVMSSMPARMATE